ncbi:short transient receptor potential channel 3 [Nephila pilipes]|uniref:Short transient receptor potential channel 3 n=1 Tax=Nephila pilipes TaxID=299642 RepID=A0A8X6Q0W4_NEPPI|nr:short transient receptor potential channel 3 [Nephila pilipes]
MTFVEKILELEEDAGYKYPRSMFRLNSNNCMTFVYTAIQIQNSFITLFWGMLGMSDADSADLVVQNHNFTQGVARTLWATYEVLMTIALVNTLIAILSNTFQRVVDNSDVEFKYHRTILWMHFFDDSTLVPSPFNLIPTVALFRSLGEYCQAMGHKIPRAKARFSIKVDSLPLYAIQMKYVTYCQFCN